MATAWSTDVYFRGEDETQWKLLRADMHENFDHLRRRVFADGKYLLPRGGLRPRGQSARHRRATAQLVSAPVTDR